MVKVIVLLRGGGGRAVYDEQYNQFLVLLDTLPGLRRKSVSTVFGGPGGATPYQACVEAFFDDNEALRAALTSPPGIEAGRLLLAFAGDEAITLFAEVQEEDFANPG